MEAKRRSLASQEPRGGLTATELSQMHANNPFNTQEEEWDAYMEEQEKSGNKMRDTTKRAVDEFFAE